MVVEDGELVEDASHLGMEPPAVDLVGEDGDELQLRGHEAEAFREPVLRETLVFHRRRRRRHRGRVAGEETS